MSATPPGVDELDPARLDPEELRRQFDGVEPTGEADAEDDPQDKGTQDPGAQDPDTPPASPDGHHQTHSVPVATN